jgi:hypothetical protein
MPLVTEALASFLNARQTPANADLIARWSPAMECQVNVAVGDGEPVPGKRSTYSNGTETWHAIRIPKDAGTQPSWEDYELRYPFDVHAEGIGMTGWDWQNRCSRWTASDFDSLVGHARGVGVTEDELERVKQAAQQLPFVEVRRSTRGQGLHLYTYYDGIPCENHTIHAALARCVLGMMSSECGFDFASQVDALGGVMWIWHRKMSAENGGLSVIKPATKILTLADIPANWRDNLEVVTRKRSKVRINGISEDKLDTFETLASAQKIIPLDDRHKAVIEALQRSSYTTLWVADHHLLQTHTCALKDLMDGPEAADLKLVGAFDTNSQGRNPGNPNAFMFPLLNGGWRVFRFSPGVVEAATWTQDGAGWTSCYFNRRPDMAAACKIYGGCEDGDHPGNFTFTAPDDAIKAASLLGNAIEIEPIFADRHVTLKTMKDGRLAVEVEQRKGDAEWKAEPKGWLNKKSKWVRVYDVRVDAKDDDLGANEYDKLLRHVETPDGDNAGWRIKKNGMWGSEPYAHCRAVLQYFGEDKTQAEAILGGSTLEPWRLVNLPFQSEYPGGRRWNLGAAQFKVAPAVLADDEAPKHPHWDLILNHIGNSLTPAIQKLPWAADAGIKTGGDYLRMWVACMVKDPFEPTPYLFLYGPENSGKSIFHESLETLITRGLVRADRVLTTKGDFNGELANAILCIVEEKQISKHPGAMNKIKEWVTARRISIRRMQRDSYEQDSTLHWVQISNFFHACPVFPGDTRITVVEVPYFTGAEIPRKEMEAFLAEEAPHFLATLMALELPPLQQRLRLPPIETEDKADLAAEMTPMSQFLNECCEFGPDYRIIKKKLHRAYNIWSYENSFGELTDIKFGEQLMAVSNNQIRAKGQMADEHGKMKHVYRGVQLKKEVAHDAD